MPKYIARALYLGPHDSDAEQYRYLNSENLKTAIKKAKEFNIDLFDDDIWPKTTIAQIDLKRVGRKYIWHRVRGSWSNHTKFQNELDDLDL